MISQEASMRSLRSQPEHMPSYDSFGSYISRDESMAACQGPNGSVSDMDIGSAAEDYGEDDDDYEEEDEEDEVSENEIWESYMPRQIHEFELGFVPYKLLKALI